MVVVAIIAFVSAAVVPSFSMMLQRNRQREAAVLIVEAVFSARSRAARSGRCHRVEIQTGVPARSGGTGGHVAVYESNQGECSQASGSLGVWTLVSAKSVGGGPVAGQNRVGLVGEDVAISAAVGAATDPDVIDFESSGGRFMRNGAPRAYQVTMYTSAGLARGLSRRVTVNSGGAVRFGN
jgi:Tfp pilus assembly protein FimT